jgi:PAS domain S-box-containing protein
MDASTSNQKFRLMLDFESLTASDSRPCLLIDRSGTIVAANGAARAKIEALKPGAALTQICAQPDGVREYLARCAGTRGPLPGALTVKATGGSAVKWRCDGGHFAGPGEPNAVILRMRPVKDAHASFVELSKQIGDLNTKLRQSRDAERAAAHLAAIVTSSSDGIISKTLDGVVTSWNSGAQRIFGYTAQEMVGQSITRLLPAERLSEEDDILTRIRAGQIIDQFETVRMTKDGRNIDVSVTISPLRSGTGQIIGASKIVRDITESKQREKLVETLLREVNHRSKNMLGLVLAIARQTANGAPEHFLSRFSDRIHALAASQDLLVKSDWSGTPLDDLVRAQLAHFDGLIGTRIKLQGPPARLNAAAAQNIGMALHEMATNAAKYGALSNEAGAVEIEWGRTRSGSGNKFCVIWRESGGPPVVEPTRRGFGTTVISRLVSANLAGTVDIDYAPKGFSWRLRCPLTNVLDEAELRPGAGA